MIPQYVFDAIGRLERNGYEAYLVGGAVRDMLLNRQPKDYDICTSATPEEVMAVFPNHLETGLKHGTVTVGLDKDSPCFIEVTTFRVDGKYSDNRRPDEVTFVRNIKEDLARRDFTINAIAWN